MNVARGVSGAALPLASTPIQPTERVDAATSLANLVVDLQARGLRVEVPLERRHGGAGPTDSGMLWVGGFRITVPTDNTAAAASPYALKAEDDGYAIFRARQRLATASPQRRPRFYDLTPPMASRTGRSACCTSTPSPAQSFRPAPTGATTINASSAGSASPWTGSDHRQEEPGATGRGSRGGQGARWRRRRDVDNREFQRGRPGRRYVARCGHAVKDATGLPVEVQFEPPRKLEVIDEVADLGIDSVGIHVESFDPAVLAHVAPAKARTGIEAYFRAWERAVDRFGEGQVSTYVILGMGEDPELTVQGCRRAIDMGVFPLWCPSVR